MLNIVYVTMMFGLGLPILFPVAAVSLFFLEVTDRYDIAYSHKLPPTMN
jgi:hypothetical protein